MKKIGLVFLMAIMGCSMIEVEPSSIIGGKVTIGPLCGNVPVGETGLSKDENPCGLSNEGLDEIYGKYSVILKTTNDVIIAQKKLDRTGNFTFAVNEGSYHLVIDSEVTGVLTLTQKEQLKKTISIAKNANQNIVFTIDTGIR